MDMMCDDGDHDVSRIEICWQMFFLGKWPVKWNVLMAFAFSPEMMGEHDGRNMKT